VNPEVGESTRFGDDFDARLVAQKTGLLLRYQKEGYTAQPNIAKSGCDVRVGQFARMLTGVLKRN
jgi:hypothetical protein